MIKIKPSPTADSRTCDFSKVTKEQLLESSHQHISDVDKGIMFFAGHFCPRGIGHDYDKISDIDTFYADFKTGFKTREWYEKHKKLGRHHLQEPEGIPRDVNLLDVLEMIVDCVMAGMARKGEVYPIVIQDEVLKRAFENTVTLLKENVCIEQA